MTRKLVNLKDNNDILVPEVLAGIDTNNILASISYSNVNYSYTATQNCIIIGTWYCIGTITAKIDGVGVNIYPDGERTAFIYLRAGQTFTWTFPGGGARITNLTIYGLKY